jgi:catechol 2,3-dioxygenase
MSTVVEVQDVGGHPAECLPAGTHVGRVRLAVSNLERSIWFYSQVIGLAVLEQDGRTARLGAHDSKQILLELVELPGVRPLGQSKRLGLYHTAFLLPTRQALGSFVRHLKELGVRFGAGDHIYSEAIYLTDPDGLDVEVYADRDRSAWIFEGQEIVSATHGVGLSELMDLSDGPWTGAPQGTTVGHVHLYIGNLEQAAAFYHAALGMDIVTWRFPGALFLSAGGYHHHVGLNTWASVSPQATEADARLLHWELAFSEVADLERTAERLRRADYEETTGPMGAPAFKDPWGITVALVRERVRQELAA